LGEFNPECVVISSPKYEQQIWNRRAVVESQGIRMMPAFGDIE
jgi:hypothetical protein